MTERFTVVNHADGMMTITAYVRSPPTPIRSFDVQGSEAVKRYKKYITLTAAGILAQFFPEFVPVVMEFVSRLGPDSDAVQHD